MLAYAWVHRFPMYKWDEENGRWDATHNPFSGVLPEDEALLVTASGDPAARRRTTRPAGRGRSSTTSRSTAGSWAAARSASTAASCSRSFPLQGHTPSGCQKFGAILEAFEYGAPPHGGIALGIDRWAALLTDQTNIREVMAFPKTQSGTDLMLEAPSPADPAQCASWASPSSAGRGGPAAGERARRTTARPQTWQVSRPRRPVAPSADAASGPTGMTPTLRILTAGDTAALSAGSPVPSAGDMSPRPTRSGRSS